MRKAWPLLQRAHVQYRDRRQYLECNTTSARAKISKEKGLSRRQVSIFFWRLKKKKKVLELRLKDIVTHWRSGQKKKRPRVRSQSPDKQINIAWNTTMSRNTEVCWLCQVRFVGFLLSMLSIDQELIYVTQGPTSEGYMLWERSDFSLSKWDFSGHSSCPAVSSPIHSLSRKPLKE